MCNFQSQIINLGENKHPREKLMQATLPSLRRVHHVLASDQACHAGNGQTILDFFDRKNENENET